MVDNHRASRSRKWTLWMQNNWPPQAAHAPITGICDVPLQGKEDIADRTKSQES